MGVVRVLCVVLCRGCVVVARGVVRGLRPPQIASNTNKYNVRPPPLHNSGVVQALRNSFDKNILRLNMLFLSKNQERHRTRGGQNVLSNHKLLHASPEISIGNK